jgi:PPE-repeat protein
LQDKYDYDLEKKPIIEENLANAEQELNQLIENSKKTATGEIITLTNSDDKEVYSIKINGFFNQAETPSLTNPQEVKTLESNFTISATGDNNQENSIIYALSKGNFLGKNNILLNGTLTQKWGKYEFLGFED